MDSESSDTEDSDAELEERKVMRSVLDRQSRLKNMNAEKVTGEALARKPLGFGDLCRYFQKYLSKDSEDDAAYDVGCDIFYHFVKYLFRLQQT